MQEVCLVTGAGGFIGSHLVQHLVESGKRVRAMVRYNSRGSVGWLASLPSPIVSELDIVFGDVRDAESATKAVSGCSQVFNLAALIGIPYSYEAPDAYVDVNIQGCLNLLQASRRLGITRFVQMSTSEVYGTARQVPISEDHPLQPQSPYSASKIGAEQLALSYHYSFELPVTIARPFNTYGERQSARAIIPTIICQLLSGSTKIELGALTPTRDFTYVGDTVRGLSLMGDSEQTVGQVVNLGSNFEIAIGDLVTLIAEVLNVDCEVVSTQERLRPAASEVERLWADNSRAQALLDWTPDYGGLKGLKRAMGQVVDWFKVPENRAHYVSERYNV